MSTLRAGVARVKITPPLGAQIAGYYYERRAEEIHDDLWARALVISDGKKKIAFVASDLIGLKPEITAKAKALMQREVGLPPEAALLSATHTHTGPRLACPAREGEYAEGLGEKLAQSVRVARESMQEVRLAVARAEERSLSFCRRYFMRDGSVVTNPGFLNPDILRATGPIDPQIGILLFEGGGGTPVAIVVNFTLHCDTIGGNLISAGWPHFLEKNIQAELGDVPILFLNGAAGNINHFNVKKPGPQRGFEVAEHIGKTLAEDVISALEDKRYIEDAKLAAALSEVHLPCERATKEEIRISREILERPEERTKDFTMDRVWARKIISLTEMEEGEVASTVQALAIGEVVIVGVPGELFVELGLEIRKRSPFPRTFIVELTSDSVGYIPHPGAFEQGGYEVVSSKFMPDVGTIIVNKALELLKGLRPPAARC